MFSIQIKQFDPNVASWSEWQAFHNYRRARFVDDAIDEPLAIDDELERSFKTAWPLWQTFWWTAWKDGRIVGNLSSTVRRVGTDAYAEHAPYIEAWIGVLSDYQRQGLARQLFTVLTDFMREQVKSVLSMNARTPAGHAFLQAMGMRETFLKMKNRLDLASVDWPAMARWKDAAIRIDPSLRWEIHAGRVPFERWQSLIEPLSVLLNQQPLDELNAPEFRYEMPQIEKWYAELDRTGGQHYLVLLKAGDAADAPLVGVSNGEWDARTPEWVAQYLTGVVADRRGQGFAKAVKARLLELVRSHQAEARWVGTYNAKRNAPMLAINRSMGFTVMREIGTYQTVVLAR
jgi:GNAT superfamily N-acetyltransferase